MDELIAKINDLSRKMKTVGLNEEEYLQVFRNNFKQQLDNIEITDEKPTLPH
jgi:uncharacterized protein YnzC (UPF0291/DUF896 family)